MTLVDHAAVFFPDVLHVLRLAQPRSLRLLRGLVVIAAASLSCGSFGGFGGHSCLGSCRGILLGQVPRLGAEKTLPTLGFVQHVRLLDLELGTLGKALVSLLHLYKGWQYRSVFK